MRARKALALPLIAVLAVAGGLLVAGCGGSDNSSTSANETTLQSQNASETNKSEEAMKHDDDSMKHDEEDAMEHEGGAMKKEGKNGEAMKHDDSMKHDEEDAMKHDE